MPLPTKSFERSRAKLVLLLVASVCLVLLSLWILVLGLNGDLDDPIISFGIGPIGIGLFGLSGIYCIRKMFDASPGLVLDGQGLFDNASGIAAGHVPWSEIVDIGEYQINRQKFVSIFVSDPEKYIRRSNSLKTMLNRANMKMVGTPINISSTGLKTSHSELLDTIVDYFNAYHQ